MEEIIPARYLSPEQQEEFLTMLRTLPLDPEDKKLMLLYWCDRLGVKLTAELVKRAGAR